jgi:hypothetical protein
MKTFRKLLISVTLLLCFAAPTLCGEVSGPPAPQPPPPLSMLTKGLTVQCVQLFLLNILLGR